MAPYYEIKELAERVFGRTLPRGMYAALDILDGEPVLILHDGQGNDSAVAHWDSMAGEWAVDDGG